MLDFNETGPQAVDVALAHAARGWPVFPCNPLNKSPLTPNGFKQATLNSMQIRAWWARYPNAMVGIPTGEKVGFWVLDIDTDEAKGKDGLGSLATIDHYLEELTDTVVSRTASGGYHCLFKYDPAQPLTNARGALPRHLDVRGEGGYIIAPGSRLSDGREYAWLNPPDEIELADAPDWLLDLVRHGTPAPASSFDFNNAKPTVTPAARVAAIEPGRWHENTRDLVARMVREGASDDTIAAIAPRFTQQGYSDHDTVREFLTHARTARQKWGYKPREIEAAEAEITPDTLKVPIFTRAALKARKRPESLIYGVIYERTAIALYGPSGTLKSFAAIDMAMCIASGAQWHGRDVKQGPVVYVTGEGQDQIAARLDAWDLAHGIEASEAPIFIVPFGVPVSDPAWLRHLVAAIESVCDGGPVLIWLDTLARTFGAGDENSQRDMNAYVSGMDYLRAHFGCAVGTVHHTGKDAERGLRGSSNLYAAMDTVIRADRKPKSPIVTLKNQQPHGKQKDASEFDDIPLQTKVIDLPILDEKGVKVTSLALIDSAPETSDEGQEAPETTRAGRPQGAVQTAIMEALKRAKGEPLGLTRLVTMSGKESNSVLAAVNALTAKGVLNNVGEGERSLWVKA